MTETAPLPAHITTAATFAFLTEKLKAESEGKAFEIFVGIESAVRAAFIAANLGEQK